MTINYGENDSVVTGQVQYGENDSLDEVKKKPRTWGQALGDAGAALAGGVGGLIKTGGDLYGLATGDMNNAGSELGDSVQSYWDDKKSDQLKEKIRARKADIDAQDSTLGKAWTAVADTVSDPALAVDVLASNAMTMLPGMGVGRLVGGAKYAAGMKAAEEAGLLTTAAAKQMATVAAAKEAAKYGIASAVGVGSVQQGADVSGNAYDESLKIPDEVWDANPQFQAKLQQNGGDRDKAKDAMALETARDTFLPATGISLAANAIPGARMLEQALIGKAARETIEAGTKYGLPKAIVKGALGEAGQEVIEEGGGQFVGNVAKQQVIDPNQDVWQNVGENAGMGAAGGLLMGGLGGLGHRQAPAAGTPGQQPGNTAAAGTGAPAGTAGAPPITPAAGTQAGPNAQTTGPAGVVPPVTPAAGAPNAAAQMGATTPAAPVVTPVAAAIAQVVGAAPTNGPTPLTDAATIGLKSGAINPALTPDGAKAISDQQQAAEKLARQQEGDELAAKADDEEWSAFPPEVQDEYHAMAREVIDGQDPKDHIDLLVDNLDVSRYRASKLLEQNAIDDAAAIQEQAQAQLQPVEQPIAEPIQLAADQLTQLPTAQGNAQPTTLGKQTTAQAGPGFGVDDALGMLNGQKPAQNTDIETVEAQGEEAQAMAGDAAARSDLSRAGSDSVEGGGVDQPAPMAEQAQPVTDSIEPLPSDISPAGKGFPTQGMAVMAMAKNAGTTPVQVGDKWFLRRNEELAGAQYTAANKGEKPTGALGFDAESLAGQLPKSVETSTENQAVAPVEQAPAATDGVADETDNKVIDRLRKDAKLLNFGQVSNETRSKIESEIDSAILNAVSSSIPEEDIFNAMNSNGNPAQNIRDLLQKNTPTATDASASLGVTPDYAARNSDRLNRIAQAATIEDAQAIQDNEEYTDSERHAEGTSAVEKAVRDRALSIRREAAEKAKQDQSNADFDAGQVVTDRGFADEREADAYLAKAKAENTDITYTKVTDNTGFATSWEVRKQKKPLPKADAALPVAEPGNPNGKKSQAKTDADAKAPEARQKVLDAAQAANQPAPAIVPDADKLKVTQQLLADNLETNPSSPNAPKWQAELERINALIGPIAPIEKVKPAAKEPVDRTGWSQHKVSAVDFYQGLKPAADKMALANQKRALRSLAKQTPADDEGAVAAIGMAETRIWGTEYDPKAKKLEFAPPAGKQVQSDAAPIQPNQPQGTTSEPKADQAIEAQPETPSSQAAVDDLLSEIHGASWAKGKGRIEGHYGVKVGDEVVGNYHAKPEDAIAEAKTFLANKAKRDKDAADRVTAISELKDRLITGGKVSDGDMKLLNLRDISSELKWFIPAAAEVFGISSHAVRPHIQDLIRVGHTDMGAKIESVSPRKALRAIAAALNPVMQDGQAVAPSQPSDPLANVPSGVQTTVKVHLANLRDAERVLKETKTARGDGQNLSWAVQEQQDKIDKAHAGLDKFRERAKGNNVDADAVIGALGGIPDLSPFGIQRKSSQPAGVAPAAIPASQVPDTTLVEAAKEAEAFSVGNAMATGTLEKPIAGQETPRQAVIYKAVHAGAEIEGQGSERVLSMKDGGSFTLKQLSPAGMDFAQWLIEKRDGKSKPVAQKEYRYAMVNRPVGIGTVPRDGLVRTEDRPKQGDAHYDMARNGIAVFSRELTDAETKQFEMATIADDNQLAKHADLIVENMGEYADAYAKMSKSEPDYFAQTVADRLKSTAVGYPPSVGDMGKFVAMVAERLSSKQEPAKPANLQESSNPTDTKPISTINITHALKKDGIQIGKVSRTFYQDDGYVVVIRMDADLKPEELRSQITKAMRYAESVAGQVDANSIVLKRNGTQIWAVQAKRGHAPKPSFKMGVLQPGYVNQDAVKPANPNPEAQSSAGTDSKRINAKQWRDFGDAVRFNLPPNSNVRYIKDDDIKAAFDKMGGTWTVADGRRALNIVLDDIPVPLKDAPKFDKESAYKAAGKDAAKPKSNEVQPIKPKNEYEAEIAIQDGNVSREIFSLFTNERNEANRVNTISEWRKQFFGNHAETIASGDIAASDHEKITKLVDNGSLPLARAIEMIDSAATAGVLDARVAEDMKRKVSPAQEVKAQDEQEPASVDAMSIAKSHMADRFEATVDDLNAVNRALGDKFESAYVGSDSATKVHVADIVANENLKTAPTEKINKRIDSFEKKISKSMDNSISGFDPGRLGGRGAAGRVRDRERSKESRAILKGQRDRLQAEIDRRNAKAKPALKTGYIKGDLVEYTGKTETVHGGLFHEFKYLEGHKKGQIGVTQNGPEKQNVNLESFIKIAADSIEKLRKDDVERVINETPIESKGQVAQYIRENRKDLAQEVDDVLNDDPEWIAKNQKQKPSEESKPAQPNEQEVEAKPSEYEIASRLDELLHAPYTSSGKPKVSFGTNREENEFKRGFKFAVDGGKKYEQQPGVPAKEQKYHDAFANGWSQGTTWLRMREQDSASKKPTHPAAPVAPQAAPAYDRYALQQAHMDGADAQPGGEMPLVAPASKEPIKVGDKLKHSDGNIYTVVDVDGNTVDAEMTVSKDGGSSIKKAISVAAVDAVGMRDAAKVQDEAPKVETKVDKPKKKPAGATNLRKAAYEKNPLLTFLATYGLYHEKDKSNSMKSEFSPDKNIMVMGYGPIFKRTGKDYSTLVPMAIEDGYLPQGGTDSDLYDLIQRAVRGEKIIPMYAEGVADAFVEQSFEEHLRQQQEAAQDEDYDPFDSVEAIGFIEDDAEISGYDKALDSIKLEVNALLAKAQELGIDIDTLKEDAYYATAEQSEQAHFEYLRESAHRAIKEAIERGNRDSSTNASSASNEGKEERVAAGLSAQAPEAPVNPEVEVANEPSAEAPVVDDQSGDMFGDVPSPDDFALSQDSPEKLQQREDAAREAAAIEAEKNRAAGAVAGGKKRSLNHAEEKARADKVRKERADAAVDDFAANFGNDAPSSSVSNEEAAGQGSVFDAPPDRSAEMQSAMDDFMGALSDGLEIINIGRANMMPEQRAKFLPVMVRLFDAAFRMGYIKFKDSAKFVLDAFKSKLGEEQYNEITLEHLQAGYMELTQKPGADTKRTVIDVEDKAEIEAHTAQTDQQRKEKSNVPSANGDMERHSQEPAVKPAVGNPVSPEPGGTPANAGEAGGQGSGGRGGRQLDGVSLSSGSPAASGDSSNQRVSGGRGTDGPAGSIAGGELGERSAGIGFTGIPPEPIPANQVAAAARTLADTVEKAKAQRAAESVKPVDKDLQNIRDTLPQLFPAQHEDVQKIEARFAKPDGFGMLITNGTGTGKTFSGLGVVKRLAMQGKDNTLILVPDDKIAADWMKAGKLLGLDITKLADTKDAGKGIVITTYANFGANDETVKRQWDLVVADEAHTLMQDANGTVTTYLKNLRAITLQTDGAFQRAEMLYRDDIAKIVSLRTWMDTARGKLNKTAQDIAEINQKSSELNALINDLNNKRDAIKAEVAASQNEKRPRLLALSATPFAYEKTIDWANGYLFDYNTGRGDPDGYRGYNVGSNRDQYFMQNFGYSMRTNKLTAPGPNVDSGLLQRQWNTGLKQTGVLSGRMLDVPFDYDRRFVTIDSGIGARIDEAIEWVNDKRHDAEKGNTGFRDLSEAIDEQFDYQSKRYLLEAIKANAAIKIVNEHLAMGRKVVVFHDFKQGGGFNPFAFNLSAYDESRGSDESKQSREFRAAVSEFNAKFPNLIGAAFSNIASPIEVFKRELPQTMLINGDEKKSELPKRYDLFQDDNSGPQVMLVQADKNKGWSGHDTTGKHQRVLINLGQPTAPTKAIQQEGRIYRTGQASDAIIRYLNTGTNWERWAFASTIAARSETAENLGMGVMARALKDSFIQSFAESDSYPAGHEGEGTGGKARDKAANDAITEYDRAKTFYWATQKKNSATKAQEGVDYFATPEPVGLKMVEWLDARVGEELLEPSAGHGAIARWMPSVGQEDSKNGSRKSLRTVIEPSLALRSRLALVMNPNQDRIIDGTFEDLNVVNKYDGIVMNPPFGHGGKTAIEHLAKAVTHLRFGGRIVALIPTGPAADARFEKWFNGTVETPIRPLVKNVLNGESIYKGDTVTYSNFMGVLSTMVVDSQQNVLGVQQFVIDSKGNRVQVSFITKIEPTGQRTESVKSISAKIPVKPLFTHQKLGDIYRGDTLTTGFIGNNLSFLIDRIESKSKDGPFFVYAKDTPVNSGINMVGFDAVEPTGQRTQEVSVKDLHLVADIKMPSVTFERAGTAVATRIVVLERVNTQPKIIQRDLTEESEIGELFNAIENLKIPTRTEVVAKEAPKPADAPKAAKAAATPEPAKATANVGDEVTLGGKKYEIEIYTTNDGKDVRGVWMGSRAEALQYARSTFTKNSGPKKGKWFLREKNFPKDAVIDKPLKASRTTTPAPNTPLTAIRQAISNAYGGLLGKLEGRGLVTLTQTQDEAIEAAAKARAKVTGESVEIERGKLLKTADIKRSADGHIQGFFDPVTGKSYLIANNLTASAAPGVLMHEVGVHMNADGSMEKLHNRAKTMTGMNKGNPFFDEVQRRMDAAGESAPDEYAAYITELYERDRANAPNAVKQWFKDLLAAVKAWLFKRGMLVKAEDLTAADIAAVARANAREVAQGKTLPPWLPEVNDPELVENEWTKGGRQSLFYTPTGIEIVDFFVPNGKPKATKIKASRAATEQPNTPWYSELSRQVQANKSQAMPAGMWRAWIDSLATKGVKPAEVEWSGVKDFLALQQGKVAKSDVVAYLDANGVQVEETVLGNIPEVYKADNNKWYVKGSEYLGYSETKEDAEKLATRDDVLESLDDKTKYADYQLPGGENYREVLLTLPKSGDVQRAKLDAINDRYNTIMNGRSMDELPDSQRAEIERLTKEHDTLADTSIGSDYHSSHWSQPNVLAHIRISDRTDSQGRKTMFVEEVQSDFGQDTREAKQAIKKAVDDGFEAIVKRMKQAGVLEVNCD